MKIRLIKTGDVFFLAALIALFIWGTPYLLQGRGESSTVIVEVDGQPVYRLELKQDSTYALTDFQPPVKINVRRHQVRITENDCAHKICMHMGPISRPGQMIVCVPKKILIYIPAEHDKQKSINAITG